MSEPLFSASWHRVAELRPRLRAHAEVHRHVYRGQAWYVLRDQASARLHRFTPTANAIIGLMDGTRTVQSIWEATCEVLGDDAPGQDEVIALLARLHQADLLQTQARPDAEEAQRRHAHGARARLAQRFKNPFAVRIPLLDPDRLLDALRPIARALFSAPMAIAWVALVLAGLAVAGAHAGQLTTHVAERALETDNLLLIALLLPVVKLAHELGHALAVKRWDGHVHEVGIMLLVLAPLPYVDASGSAAFGEKHRRMIVSGAGIAVELALAALAAIVWVGADAGWVRDVALDVMLIGSVSTVLFNGNPLLRFDGYYVLADLIEIPNLAQRARRYLGYLVLRYAFGVKVARSPVTAPGEAAWFVVYGIASGVYRLVVAVSIIAFVAGRFFVVGIVLAVMAAAQMLLLPAIRHFVFLARSPLLERRRAWAVTLVTATAAMLGAAVFLVPVPLATHTEGVVWLPDDARVRASGSGFVQSAHAAHGDPVHKGQLLFELEDPLRLARMKVAEARISELEVQHAVETVRDRVQAGVIEQQLHAARAELERERERTMDLSVQSPADGVLVLADGASPVGRYVRQGDELAVVVDGAGLTVRAVVEQPDIALLRDRLEAVQVRFADRIDQTHPARLVHEVPTAQYVLPSRVLGSAGGGRIPVEPGDRAGLKVKHQVFEVELALAERLQPAAAGQRVHVRFGHGVEPLAAQLRRRVEQIFLRRFGV